MGVHKSKASNVLDGPKEGLPCRRVPAAAMLGVYGVYAEGGHKDPVPVDRWAYLVAVDNISQRRRRRSRLLPPAGRPSKQRAVPAVNRSGVGWWGRHQKPRPCGSEPAPFAVRDTKDGLRPGSSSLPLGHFPPGIGERWCNSFLSSLPFLRPSGCLRSVAVLPRSFFFSAATSATSSEGPTVKPVRLVQTKRTRGW